MAKRKPKKRCLLVDDWRHAHRWLSVRFMAIIFASESLLAFVPTIKEWIPANVAHVIMAGLAIGAILGRVINQQPK